MPGPALPFREREGIFCWNLNKKANLWRHFSNINSCLINSVLHQCNLHFVPLGPILCTYVSGRVRAQSTYLYRGEQGKFDDASAPTFVKHGNCRENKNPLPPPLLPHVDLHPITVQDFPSTPGHWSACVADRTSGRGALLLATIAVHQKSWRQVVSKFSLFPSI